MQKIEGYKISTFHPRILTLTELKEQFYKLTFAGIRLDGKQVSGDKCFELCSEEAPLVITSFAGDYEYLNISKKYYLAHRQELNEIIAEICEKKEMSSFILADNELINITNINAIIKNKNLKKIELGSYEIPYVLTSELYKKFKNSQLESVKTYAVTHDLEENFDDLIEYNKHRHLVSYYNYNDLQIMKSISISRPLSEKELHNLKYLNKETIIYIHCQDYGAVFDIINRLKETNHVGEYIIDIDNKNTFNEFLLNHYDELIDDKNVFIGTANGEKNHIKRYFEYEKKLIKLILPALNLSPFEKFLYAYNITKKFKKYKENEQDKNSARDLYEILDSEYIVCVGYIKLLNDLLDKLGIQSIKQSENVDVGGLNNIPQDIEVTSSTFYNQQTNQEEELTTKLTGHARSLIHLVDPKYNIDGYYFSDPTWDNVLDQDYYNHALMTPEEYTGSLRYNSYNYMDPNELIFSDSLENFYFLINFSLNRKLNDYQKQGLKTDDYNNLLLKIRSLIDLFRQLDYQFYNYLVGKYEKLQNSGYDLTKKDIEEILLECGEHILSKNQNPLPGSTLAEGIKEIYQKCYHQSEEEATKNLKETLSQNKIRQEIYFPLRYKISSNGDKTVIYNAENKFATSLSGLKL